MRDQLQGFQSTVNIMGGGVLKVFFKLLIDSVNLSTELGALRTRISIENCEMCQRSTHLLSTVAKSSLHKLIPRDRPMRKKQFVRMGTGRACSNREEQEINSLIS